MIRKLFFIILPVVLFISSCKKYEEGGTHFQAYDRLVNYWTFHEFTVDGADSMAQVDSRLRETGVLRIHRPHSGSSISYAAPVLNAGYPVVVYTGSMTFKDHRNEIKFGIPSYGVIYPFTIANAEWEILEITKSEVKLRMKNYQNDKEYIMVWR